MSAKKKTSDDPDDDDNVISRAFGERNRARLISNYFASRTASDTPAWEHVYRLLLWVDQTTGLAHCYESDKSQPGRPWYERSLAFHDWIARAFGEPPLELTASLDVLFRGATTDLAEEFLKTAQRRLQVASLQRMPFADRNMPVPGEEPELVALIQEGLEGHLANDVPVDKWKALVEKIRGYFARENTRKNLVGEGFEDVVAEVVRRRAPGLSVQARALLHDLPGFNRVRAGEKVNKVDVAIVKSTGRRTLVTAKWSIRADREKQFASDFGDYVSAHADSVPFDYVLITNEFDPARLMRACEKLSANNPMFSHVVHINTDAVCATYGKAKSDSMKKVIDHIASGRLIGFDRWVDTLTA